MIYVIGLLLNSQHVPYTVLNVNYHWDNENTQRTSSSRNIKVVHLLFFAWE